MTSKGKDGAYVRSIVAMMNDISKEPSPTSPVKSPLRDSPPRTPPSYLGVSRSNNGYNNALLYGSEHRRERSIQRTNGKDTTDNCSDTFQQLKDVSSQGYVSLSQLIGTKSKTSSNKYSDLGLNLKSPERKCRSFLRNINSFERISKQGVPNLSPTEGEAVTLVGQKMTHLLHLDAGSADREAENLPPSATQENRVPENIPKSEGNMDLQSTVMADFEERVGELLSSASKRPVMDCVARDDHDGAYFKELVVSEQNRLIELADVADSEIKKDDSIPEEAKGRLRSASGKARLLVKERFKQFDGLCETNLHPKAGEKVIGPKDLMGFWEMILIEVDSIYNSFGELKNEKQNNWEQVIDASVEKSTSTTTTPQKRQVNGAKRKSGGNRKVESSEKRDEERRKNLAALRKQKKQSDGGDVVVDFATKK